MYEGYKENKRNASRIALATSTKEKAAIIIMTSIHVISSTMSLEIKVRLYPGLAINLD